MSHRQADVTGAVVGRERELAILRQELAESCAGRGRLALVGGVAGIGKTTLVEWLADEARRQGALVLRGHCYDFGTTPPYGPWREMAGRYDERGALPPFPEVLRERGYMPDGVEAYAEDGEAALFAAFQGFVAAVAAVRPLVIALEDMHWSDPASLTLLRALSLHVAALRVLLVVTFRSDELGRRDALYQLIPRLVRDAGARRIDLRPLARDAVRSLVAARYHLPAADQERLVAHVHAHAEGNPLYVRELFHTFEEQAILRPEAGEWRLGDLRDVRVPALVRQLIDERLARLDEETRRLLSVAAVIGQEVPLDLWQRAGDTGGDALEVAVEEALEARLLEEAGSADGVRFSHALIREALYEGIILTRRRAWHRRVAEAMACLPQPDPDAVAYHFQQAGDARAAEWLVRAGDRAQRTYALVIAADRFEAAAALMQGDPAREGERGWLLYRAARAVRGADAARSLACFEEAERIGVAAGDAALAAYARCDRGLVRCLVGEPRRGIAEIEAGLRALEALTPDQIPTGNAIAAWIVGNTAGTATANAPASADEGFANGVALRRGELAAWYGFSGRYRAAQELAEALVTRAPDLHDDAWMGLGFARVAAGEAEAARQAWRRAWENFRARGRFLPAGISAVEELDSVRLRYFAADRDGRERVAMDAEEAFRRADSGLAVADFTRTARLPLLVLEGEWDAARQVMERLAPIPSVAQMYYSCVLGSLNRHQGRVHEAWSCVRAAMPQGLASEPGDSVFQESLETIRLAVALALDERDTETARRWLEMHGHWLSWSGAVPGRSQDRLLWARYCRVAGDGDQARQHAEAAIAHARAPHQPLALLAALRVLGELDTEAGRHDAADGFLREALALADACAARFERALIVLALAELHAARGEQDAARAGLEEACAALTALGARPMLARADALTARLGAPPAGAALPAGLTAREGEVLRLLAAGKSNKEIAAALGMSVRTAERHIANLYLKIDVAGRAEAIAFAHRHGIA